MAKRWKNNKSEPEEAPEILKSSAPPPKTESFSTAALESKPEPEPFSGATVQPEPKPPEPEPPPVVKPAPKVPKYALVVELANRTSHEVADQFDSEDAAATEAKAIADGKAFTNKRGQKIVAIGIAAARIHEVP